MHPGNEFQFLILQSRHLITSLSKANIQIRTGIAYKKCQKFQLCTIFELYQFLGTYFCFIRHQYGSIAHRRFQKKTLNVIRKLSKKLCDQKSCEKN